MSEVLRFDGVSKSFGRHQVLVDVDLVVEDAARVHLRGANGAGKTTLLRLAGGVSRPTTGAVHVRGGAVHREAAARRHVSFVPADAPLYGALTPAEHLTWWRRMRDLPADPRQDLQDLADAGLARHANEPARHLSRGQRQRVALCLGFLADADLLLLDEPATGLDDAGRTWLADRLADRLAASRAAVIVAAHGAAPLAAGWRTVRIEAGRIHGRGDEARGEGGHA